MTSNTRHALVQTNRSLVKAKSGVKAGGLILNNHNRSLVKAKSGVKAGGLILNNHNRSLV